MNKYKAEYIDNVLTLRFDRIGQGWEQWFMLSGDRHHDNKYCNRELEEKQLRLAKEREALILDFGDLFCAMQGKYDPRKSYDEIRPEDVGENYLDRIVDHAAEFYTPYAINFALIGRGNHDANILKRFSHDIVSDLAKQLRKAGSNVVAGGYQGWVRFQFVMRKTVRQRILIKYYHGKGGTSAPVTKGVIDTNRQAASIVNADIVVNGHNHQNYVLPVTREYLTEGGKIKRNYMWFARTPGYEDGYFGRNGYDGFAAQQLGAPHPIGCVWLRLTYYEKEIKIELIPDLGG